MLPYFEGRASFGLDQLGSRTEDADDAAALGRLRRRPFDYFRMFYGDTALFGALAAMECGLAFFGADHLFFGTDIPFDPEKGPGFIRETIRCMDQMQASPQEKAKIYEGNAKRLLKLKVPTGFRQMSHRNPVQDLGSYIKPLFGLGDRLQANVDQGHLVGCDRLKSSLQRPSNFTGLFTFSP